MATEIELKLALSADALATLRAHPLLSERALAEGHSQLLDNHYFDTPERALLAARVSLRIREQGGVFIQTLKTAGTSVAGLHSRAEYNVSVPGPQLDLDRFSPSELPEVLADKRVRDALQCVFTTRFERYALRVRLSGGGEAELALDSGEILSEDRRAHLCELELELLSGEPVALFDFAEELAALVPMHISNISKAQRGYALASHTRHTAQDLPRIALTQGLTVSDAFARVFAALLNHSQQHALLFIGNGDDGALAKLAEANQLLRAALALFGGPVTRRSCTLVREHVNAMTEALRWQAHWAMAGEVDLRLSGGLGVYRTLEARKYLRVAVQKSRAGHKAERAQLRATLCSPAYGQTQLALGRWLVAREWEKDASPKVQSQLQQPLGPFAAERLTTLWQTLQQGCQPGHPMRKADYRDQLEHVNKLRGFSQLLASLYNNGSLRNFVAAWTDLGNGIGQFAEIEYLHELADQFDADVRAEQSAWLKRQEISLLEAMEQTRRAALKLKPYWS